MKKKVKKIEKKKQLLVVSQSVIRIFAVFFFIFCVRVLEGGVGGTSLKKFPPHTIRS